MEKGTPRATSPRRLELQDALPKTGVAVRVVVRARGEKRDCRIHGSAVHVFMVMQNMMLSHKLFIFAHSRRISPHFR